MKVRIYIGEMIIEDQQVFIQRVTGILHAEADCAEKVAESVISETLESYCIPALFEGKVEFAPGFDETIDSFLFKVS